LEKGYHQKISTQQIVQGPAQQQVNVYEFDHNNVFEMSKPFTGAMPTYQAPVAMPTYQAPMAMPTYQAPVAAAPVYAKPYHHHHHHHCPPKSCGGGYTTTGVILVLFILLVIVSRARGL